MSAALDTENGPCEDFGEDNAGNHDNVETKPTKWNEDRNDADKGLSLLEAIPEMDGAKQFRNLALVIFFTVLTTVHYIVPNVKLVMEYSGAAKNDRFVRMTLTYMITPIVITQLINLAWYIDDDLQAKDEERKRASPRSWYIRIFFLIIQMGTVQRFSQSLYYGYKSKHSKGSEKTMYLQKMTIMERDATLLKSFTSFLQGAPQFALQMYILLEGPENIAKSGIIWQLLSLAGCIYTITWGAVCCDRILGSKTSKEEIDDWRVIGMLLMWRLFTVASRMTVIALFTTLHPAYFGLGCVAHYAIMYLFIQHQKVATHNGTRAEVFLFLVGGIVYIVTDLLVKFEKNYHKYLIYYSVVFVENAIMLLVWLWETDVSIAWIRYGVAIGVTVSFFVGLIFLRLFYEFEHPNVTRCLLCQCCKTHLLLDNETMSNNTTEDSKD